MDLVIGDFNCSSYLPCATAPGAGDFDCAPGTGTNNMACVDGSGAKPVVNVYVDYGDGSGTIQWDRSDTHDLWTHMYTTPGQYRIFAQSEFSACTVKNESINRYR